jgi:2-methylisocitrate lyase-like PEP mutase family enzyme
MLDSGRTPLVTFKELEEMGYSRCSVPVMPVYAAAMDLKKALEKTMADGHNQNLDDIITPFSEFNKIIGLPEIHALEERFLTEEQIKNRYGSKHALREESNTGR